jgi:hypothetical protein
MLPTSEYRRLMTVATGRLEKQPCAVCGEAKVEGHHEDYRKPLEIVWLCHRHHRGAHKGKPKGYQFMGVEKCKHGLTEQTCAVCKDWPSLDKMRVKFPNLSGEMFLVMSPAERLTAMQTGVLSQ